MDETAKNTRMPIHFGALMDTNKNIPENLSHWLPRIANSDMIKSKKMKTRAFRTNETQNSDNWNATNWLSDSIKSKQRFPFVPWWSHPTAGSTFSVDVLFSSCWTCSCQVKGKLSRICKMNIGIFATIHWATDLILFNSKFTKLAFISKHRLSHACCIHIRNGCITKWLTLFTTWIK